MDEDELLRQFGKRVKKLRNARGYSQREFAERTGFHRTYISMVERGEKNVTLMSLVKISVGLNTRLEVLVQGLIKS